MAIYRGTGKTGTGAESDFVQLVVDAEAAAAAAQLAETNAETAEANAELAEINAETAATNAAISATNAANSATSAAISATNAANSATSASNSASTATTQASNAASSATSAATSASSASTSATNAANSATAAQTAQTAAELAETNAETAEDNAAASATSAANSATSASTSATNASNSAYAASTSATNAANSSSAAATSETNAANSATSAANSASTATTQASNAASSASASATSASNAATSETNAANSASSASTSATNAANSASAALTSETNAASSASAASTSASNAATSATNAAASASAAAASYDDFDDRYLGPKSVAPTLDNDGNALQVGALYFNTVSNYMKVWNGTTWLDAYASLSGALLAANNLSDVSNTTTSRTNLGAAASGANTDILALSGITGGISTADYLDLDVGATPAAVVGRISWDDGNGTANITLKGGNVNLAVGQELVARVYNDSGVALTDGQIVYISGAQGNRIAVKLANAASEATSAGTLGMVTEPIASGAEGFITIMGTVNGLNTTGLTAGDLVYLSASTAGAYTTTAPTAPNHRVILGYVERVHATVGSIYVKVDNGYELDELHNVVINTAADGDVLKYNSSTGVWENSKTLSGVYTFSGGTANGVAYLNGSKVLTTGSALTFDGTNLGIGTSIPASKLQVQSGTMMTPLSWASSDVAIFGNASGTAAYVQSWSDSAGGFIFSNATTRAKGYILWNNATGESRWSNDGAGSLYIRNNGADRLTIDASGNLGLGVTPSAWVGNWRVIQVGASGALSCRSDNYATILSQNWYINGSGNDTYIGSNYATYYRQTAGQHQWMTAPSGTAGNAISFTQAMTLDASGNLLVGTTSAGYSASGRGLIEINGSSSALLALRTGNTNRGYLYTQGTDMIAWAETGNFTVGTAASAFIQFQTNNTERMRIDSSGNLLVGTTSQADGEKLRVFNASGGGGFFTGTGFSVTAKNTQEADSGICYLGVRDTSGYIGYWIRAGSFVGGISVTASGTTYATSSDYRLKENIAPMTGALGIVQQLKPVTYNWKVDGSNGQGFIAHELQEVIPECVTGEKDAVDKDGKPVYQGVDTSFLSATLTKAIQELKAIVDAQAAEIAELKAKLA